MKCYFQSIIMCWAKKGGGKEIISNEEIMKGVGEKREDRQKKENELARKFDERRERAIERKVKGMRKKEKEVPAGGEYKNGGKYVTTKRVAQDRGLAEAGLTHLVPSIYLKDLLKNTRLFVGFYNFT